MTASELDEQYIVLLQSPWPLAVLKGENYAIAAINAPLLALWGKKANDVLHQPFFEVVPHAFGRSADGVFGNASGQQPSFNYHDKTTQRQYQFVRTSLKNRQGQPDGWLLTGNETIGVTDTTPQLDERQNALIAAMESSPDCFKTLDTEGRLLYMNRNGQCLMCIDDFGLVEGKFWWDLWGTEEQELVREAVKKAKAGEVVRFQAVCPTADGTKKWWDVTVSPDRVDGGPVQQLLSVSKDITPLKNAEEGLELTLRHVPSAIYHLDAKGNILYLNDLAAQQMGFASAEEVKACTSTYGLLQKLDETFVIKDEQGNILPPEKTCSSITIATSTSAEVVMHFISKKDDSEFWLLTRAVPFFDEGGALQRVFTSCTDITQQKRTEQKLRDSEALWRSTFNSAAVGIAQTRLDGTVLYANEHLANVLGYSVNELLQMSVQQISHPGDGERDLRLAQELIEGKSDHYTIEKRYVHKNGSLVWGHASVSIVRTQDGDPGYFVSVLQDITKRKHAEEEVRYQKTLLETVTENTDMALFMMDEQQYCMYMNEAAEQLAGFKLDELKGKQLHYHIHHTHPDGTPFPLEECPIDQALPTQKRMKGEEVFVHRDGSFYPVAFTASPILVEGKAIGTVIEVRNTAEEKAKERALRESESRFQNLVRDASIGIILLTGKEMKVEIVNDACGALIERTPAELFGKYLFEVIPEAESQYRPILEDVMQSGEPLHLYDSPYRVRKHDRVIEGFLNITYQPYFDEEGNVSGVLALLQDTTESVKAKKALEASEAKFRSVIEHAPAAIGLFVGRDLVIESPNQTFVDIVGKGWGIVGKPLREAMPELISEGQPYLQILDDVYTSGKTFSTPGSLVKIVQNGVMTERYYNFTYSPLFDEAGKVWAILDIAIDVTVQIQSQRAIAESEARFRNILEQTPEPMLVLKGEDLVVEVANEPLFRTWRTDKSALGKPLLQSRPELKGQGIVEMMLDVLHNKKVIKGYDRPVVYDRGNGETETMYYNFVYSPYVEASGEVTGVLVIGTDVTGSVLARQKLEESEKQFRDFSNNLNSLAWIADGEGWIFWYNQRWYEYTGTDLEEMKGWGWEKVHHPDHIDRVVSFVKEAWTRPEPWELTFPLRNAKGGYCWFLTRAVPILGTDGAITRWIGTNTNIHEQKMAEEAATKSNERYRLINKATQDAIWDWNLQTNEVLWNEALYQMFGYRPEQVQETAQWWYDHLHPEDRERVVRGIHKVIDAAGVNWTDEYRFACANGSYKTVLDRAFILHDASGVSVRMLGSMQDITERKEAEEAIRERESRFRSLTNDTPAFFFTADADTNLDFVNRQWLDFTGLSEDEGYGKVWERVTHPDDVAPMYAVYRTAAEKKIPYQFEIRQKNTAGEYRWILWSGKPRLDAHGALIGIVGIGIDITEQKRVQDIIRESETRFRLLAESLPQMIWVNDAQGNTEYRSSRWLEYSGIEDITEAWQWMVHPEDKELVTNAWEASFKSRAPFRYEVRLRNRQNQYRWHQGIGEPVFDAGGALIKWVGSLTDIEEQKSFALKLESLVAERTQELKRSNEDLQHFAHVASHDLKEPVRKIKTFVSRLQNEFDSSLPDRAKTFVAKIDDAATRSYNMVEGVLQFSQLGSTQDMVLETIQLGELIEQVKTDLEVPIAQKRAAVRYSGLPTIQGVPTLMHQLFYNLINNSLKFSKREVPPVVEIRGEERPEQREVIIVLQDNGIGFDTSQADFIFQTFSRLHHHTEYEGTGMGLSLCKRIVERHGGRIEAEGKPNEGALFRIFLPGV